MTAIGADECISALLRKGNSDLSNYMEADVLAIRSPIVFGLDQAVRQEIDNLHPQADDRPPRLTVLLQTNSESTALHTRNGMRLS